MQDSGRVALWRYLVSGAALLVGVAVVIVTLLARHNPEHYIYLPRIAHPIVGSLIFLGCVGLAIRLLRQRGKSRRNSLLAVLLVAATVIVVRLAKRACIRAGIRTVFGAGGGTGRPV